MSLCYNKCVSIENKQESSYIIQEGDMKTFQYTVKEELGMHARPAGLILQLAKEFDSQITVTNKGKTGDLKKLLSVIDLDIQYQDTVTVTVEGSDEEVAAEEMLAFFEENL